MNKSIMCIITVLFAGVIYSMPTGKFTDESLKAIAQRYTEVLAQFGKEEPGDLIPFMKALFSHDCIKKLNGTIVSESLADLYKQISAARDDVGLFKVIPVSPFIASPQDAMVVVHYEVPTQKGGVLAVMKYLICNQEALIKEIREVFNKKEEN